MDFALIALMGRSSNRKYQHEKCWDSD